MTIIEAASLRRALEFCHWIGKFIESLGSTVANSSRAFLRNPNKYPDPESFRPERWLEPEWPTYQAPLSVYPTVKGMTSFGWGQRQCLGQTLTQDEMLVACGAVCWAFDLAHQIDPVTGKTVKIDTKKSNSLLIVKPDPFEMSITVRNEKKREAVINMWKRAEAQEAEERAAFLRAATAMNEQ